MELNIPGIFVSVIHPKPSPLLSLPNPLAGLGNQWAYDNQNPNLGQVGQQYGQFGQQYGQFGDQMPNGIQSLQGSLGQNGQQQYGYNGQLPQMNMGFNNHGYDNQMNQGFPILNPQHGSALSPNRDIRERGILDGVLGGRSEGGNKWPAIRMPVSNAVTLTLGFLPPLPVLPNVLPNFFPNFGLGIEVRPKPKPVTSNVNDNLINGQLSSNTGQNLASQHGQNIDQLGQNAAFQFGQNANQLGQQAGQSFQAGGNIPQGNLNAQIPQINLQTRRQSITPPPPIRPLNAEVRGDRVRGRSLATDNRLTTLPPIAEVEVKKDL